MNNQIIVKEADCKIVSVIIVVRNESINIARVIGQVLHQDYPTSAIEIIVLDGDSDDDTVSVVEALAAKHSCIRLVTLKERGRSQALNQGIKIARGEIILRIDARTSVDENYVSRCVDALSKTGADNVGGVQVPLWNTNVQHAFGLALSHPFGVGNAQFRLGKTSGFVDSVYLGCFRKDVFERVGLFDETASVISEDSDMNQRIRDAGGKVYLDKDIKAYYYPRETYRDMWNLYFRYGGARAGNFIKHKSFTSWRQLVPPLFVLSLFSSALVAVFLPKMIFGLLAIALIYSIATIGVCLRISNREKKPMLLPLLAGAFCVMHFGWALGFWKKLLVPDSAGKYWGG